MYRQYKCATQQVLHSIPTADLLGKEKLRIIAGDMVEAVYFKSSPVKLRGSSWLAFSMM